MTKQTPSDYIQERINARRLTDYLPGRCKDLMNIYEIGIPLNYFPTRTLPRFPTGTVVAPDPETAIWNYLTREDPINAEKNYNQLYKIKKGKLKKRKKIKTNLATKIGQFPNDL